MKLLGRAITTVTATAQKLSLDVQQPHTLINSGANLVAYRHSDGEALTGASETALRAVGGGILHPGERVTLPAGFAWVEVACATGATSTLRVEPGAVTPGVQLVADLDIGDVNVLNAEGTKISPATEAKQNSQIAIESIADTNAQATQSITGSAASLASGAAYKHWKIWSDAGSADIHLRFSTAGSDATTSYPKYGSGDVCVNHFDTAQKCSMIGASAAGNVNFIAW